MKTSVIGFALVGAAAVASLVIWGDDAADLPPHGDTAAAAAMTDAFEPGAPLVEVTLPETLSAEGTTGETYYNAVCRACHGVNGGGQDGVAPPLVHVIYEPSHHGDAAFYSAVRNGVNAHHWPFGNMPPVEQRLTDGEIGAIVTYIRELQRANGIN